MSPVLVGAVRLLLVAQSTQANVVGTVRDEQTGEPLAGALVALTDLNRATMANAEGRYLLTAVPAGPQHITVRFIGYAPRVLHALVPLDGLLEINVSLRHTPVRLAPIDVAPLVAIRGADSSVGAVFPDRTLAIAAVRNHPMLAEPDVFEAVGGGEIVLRSESPGGVHLRGGSADHTAYLLDGIPVLSPYHAAGVFSAWNPDALSEVSVRSSAPSPGDPDALSGTVVGVTRAPGARIGAQGGFSTTQARVTLDGPLGLGDAGLLVSLRSGFPGLLAPKREPSYQLGETADWLAKLEASVLGGRLRLLGYHNENEIDISAIVTDTVPAGQTGLRNAFRWRSQSLGAEWSGVLAERAGIRIMSWSAALDAGADWATQSGPVVLTSFRRDEGLLAAVELGRALSRTTAGFRVERSRTSYVIDADSASGQSWQQSARTTVASLFAQHARPVGARVNLELGASIAASGSEVYAAPRARLQWHISRRLALSGTYARQYQFAQSLRNAESVVGMVFPVDLYLGSGAPGVPVARSDQGLIAADFRVRPGVRVGAQVYQRHLGRLLLVAPREGEPFATGSFVVGSGSARGLSVDAAISATRYGVTASYGWQRVRREYGDSSYVPDHGTAHLLEGGVIIFPTATFSLRVGAAGALGRRTTAVAGGFEWGSCNLLDRGCEFRGSPHHGGETLGGTVLPGYFRVDLGLRKHWHVEIGGHDAVVALFGTITNLLNRRNVLTYAPDPATGQRAVIDMRPLSPLVVGLDWRF